MSSMSKQFDPEETPVSGWSEWRGRVTQALEGLENAIAKSDGQNREDFKAVYTKLEDVDKRLSRIEGKVIAVAGIASVLVSVIVAIVSKLIK
jgi:hypothetical protein